VSSDWDVVADFIVNYVFSWEFFVAALLLTISLPVIWSLGNIRKRRRRKKKGEDSFLDPYDISEE
jgi:hypothetical protein